MDSLNNFSPKKYLSVENNNFLLKKQKFEMLINYRLKKKSRISEIGVVCSIFTTHALHTYLPAVGGYDIN